MNTFEAIIINILKTILIKLKKKKRKIIKQNYFELFLSSDCEEAFRYIKSLLRKTDYITIRQFVVDFFIYTILNNMKLIVLLAKI